MIVAARPPARVRERGRHAGPPVVRGRDGRPRGHRQRGRAQLGDVQRRADHRPGGRRSDDRAASASAAAFAINALSFLAVIIGLLAMRESELRPSPRIDRPRSFGAVDRPPARGLRLRPRHAARAAGGARRRPRQHVRHELRRRHPDAHPGDARQRRRRLRLPDGRVRASARCSPRCGSRSAGSPRPSRMAWGAIDPRRRRGRPRDLARPTRSRCC